MNPLNIFRPGTHTAQNGQTLTFTVADLTATAAAYDPARHEAPLVVGHPATDDPAYGWVASLAVSADGLEATPRQVDPEFAALVNAERFARISASFFLPAAPSNPVPGVYYLRHVGFLGAAAPAVKGLRKPSFNLSDLAGTVTVEFSLSPVGASGRTPVPQEVSFVSDPSTPAAPASVDYAAQAATLQAENARLLAELAAEKARQERAELAAFAESLISQGRLLPVDKPALVEFMASVPADSTLEFAAADGQAVKTAPRAWLEGFLKRLPVQVDYAERSAGSAGPRPVGADQHKAEFAASADLQAEFGDVETYLAWRIADGAGRATILGSKAQ